MAGDMRLSEGGQIDRTQDLRFEFDGKVFHGYHGDTLASALLANGVHLVGRSFKYHRPRGIISAGSEEPNAIVELRTGARREPNTRATMAELYDGLTATSQNRFPSLKFDLLSVNSLLSPIFAAGFYYKTFMWPAKFWEMLYEPMIRRAAGLGRASGEPDPDHYEKITTHCDVLVIGAGPAGLAAALAAGRSGARVILATEDFLLGGRLLGDRRIIDDTPSAVWAAEAATELLSLPEVRILTRTTVFGAYDGGTYGAVERVSDHLAVPGEYQPRQRLVRIIAKRTILAAGAIERPLLFGNNDRPGVILAGAARIYLNRFGVIPGRRVIVYSNNDDAARTVTEFAASGIEVAALVDARADLSPEIRRAAEQCGAKVFAGGAIVRTHGKLRVTAVDIADAAGHVVKVRCDLVAMSGGWSPSIHLTSHLGSKGVWNEAIAGFVPGQLPPGMSVAGAAGGHLSLVDALSEGARMGAEAATDAGFKAAAGKAPVTDAESVAISPVWRSQKLAGKAFVDYQNDVTEKDVELAGREGFRAVEHLKRYTTLGMATDQGKTSNVNGLAVMANSLGKTIPEVGATTYRPPYTPVAMGVLNGHGRGKDFRPTRLTPSHHWATEQGAVFVEVGAWLRAQYFPQAGEKDWLETVNREVLTTRSAVGICDVSTLGKIDVQGPDAAEFLERLYINAWKSLAVGKARYGLMLREDGFVMDDGTTSRLAEDRFFLTTTTANAAKVFQHMEFCHQILWPELDVQFVSVTDQWAQYSIAGPKARDVLKRVVDPEFDISNEAFPYLAVAELTVFGGMKARLFRISFSGELAYELSVPARYGHDAIARIIEAGKPFGITPYGTEALGVMRIEKGHVGGTELNGTTTAQDIGLGKMMSTKKDYIGRYLVARPGVSDPDRPALVGFKPVNRSYRLRNGAHFLSVGAVATAANDQGYMTSTAFSPMLGHWIGLGLIERGASRLGEIVRAYDPVRGGDIEVEICSPAFVDPAGERLRV